jgi:hypothetical protein
MLFQPKHWNLRMLDAPADGGEGGASAPANGEGTGNAPGGQATDPNSGKPKPITFESEDAYQAALEVHLKERLAREQKKTEAATAKAKADAEAEAAKKNGEWQKLAEQREGELAALNQRIAELEPVTGKAERYEKALTTYLTEAMKTVPAHVKTLLEKLPVDEQLAYIAANAANFKTPAGGPPATPPPADPSETDKARRETIRPQNERTVKGYFS